MSVSHSQANYKSSQVLRSEFDLDFCYTRTYGPVLSKFFSALKQRKFIGIRSQDQRVLCPPQEYDPVTSQTLEEWVELGDKATLKNWCWVHQPLDKHPLQHPFAWGMLTIDGADSLLVHAVRVDNPERLVVGLRLKPVWAKNTVGCIRDILYFESDD